MSEGKENMKIIQRVWNAIELAGLAVAILTVTAVVAAFITVLGLALVVAILAGLLALGIALAIIVICVPFDMKAVLQIGADE